MVEERLTSVKITREIEDFCKKHKIKFVDLLRRGYGLYKHEFEGVKPSQLDALPVSTRNLILEVFEFISDLRSRLDEFEKKLKG